MKIETVKELEDVEKPNHIKRLIDSGIAFHFLNVQMSDDLIIEWALNIKPDLNLLTSFVTEAYRKDNEMTDAEYEILHHALRESMPDIYNKIINGGYFWISQYFKNNIDWKRVEKLLPKSPEDGFSISPMLCSETEMGSMEVLSAVETCIQSGLILISILNRMKMSKEIMEPDPDLFRKIVITNMILKSPRTLGQKIERMKETEDLTYRCFSLLNKHYDHNLEDLRIEHGFKHNLDIPTRTL